MKKVNLEETGSYLLLQPLLFLFSFLDQILPIVIFIGLLALTKPTFLSDLSHGCFT